MESSRRKSRVLGLAFLIQFVTSFTGGVFLLPIATGIRSFGAPESIGITLNTIAANDVLVRVTVIVELITAAGVIFLGAMLHETTRKKHEGPALTGFGLYVLEGALLVVSRLVLFALLLLSRNYVAAGGPSSMEPIARLLREIMDYSFKTANFAFCLGGTIFYVLLLKARTVARPMSLWGIIGTQGVLVGLLIGLLGAKAPIGFYVPYIPFEFAIAIWILVKGTNKEEERT